MACLNMMILPMSGEHARCDATPGRIPPAFEEHRANVRHGMLEYPNARTSAYIFRREISRSTRSNPMIMSNA
jgi:hypothetical protein